MTQIITKKERKQEMLDILDLQHYILSLKEKELGELKCERCGDNENALQIHHKKYGANVNYYDLELLCVKCHFKNHKSRKVR